MKKKRFSILKAFFFTVVLALVGGAIFFANRTYQAVKKVEAYQTEITEATQKYQMENYEALVKAIILTESKGSGKDLMQSSEMRMGKLT